MWLRRVAVGVNVAAVVLAAGGGSRFVGATHKLLAEIDGQPVVTHSVLAAVEAGFDHVLVVTGAVGLDDVLPAGVEVVTNPRWAEGLATSLQAGIERARTLGCDAVVVGLGDQPFVGAADWRAVAATDTTPLAAADRGDHLATPVRIAAECWSELPTDGDVGARVLLARRPDLVTAVSCTGRPDDIDTVADIANCTDPRPTDLT